MQLFFTCRSRVRGHVARIQRRLAPALAIAAGGAQWFVLGAVMLSDVAEAAGSGCGQKAQGWRGAADALSSSPTWPGHVSETKVRHAALARGPSEDWGCLGHRWLAKGRKRRICSRKGSFPHGRKLRSSWPRPRHFYGKAKGGGSAQKAIVKLHPPPSRRARARKAALGAHSCRHRCRGCSQL